MQLADQLVRQTHIRDLDVRESLDFLTGLVNGIVVSALLAGLVYSLVETIS